MKHKRHRFVGMASFTEKDYDIFYGRDQDIDRLSTLIQVETLVVLFSKSGLGKSSLLKAGIEPRLRERGYLPLRVRFFNYTSESLSPTQVLENVLGEWQEGTFLDTLIAPAYRNTAWAKLKLLQILNPNKILLLLMDQFEELSTYPQEEIIWFKFQFGDIQQYKIPAPIEKRLEQAGKDLTSEQMALIYAPVPIRVVLSLRSDYLSFLQQFRDVVPFVLNKTYELAPLTPQTAREALLRPSQKEGKEFLTQPFSIADEAYQKILYDLGGTTAGKQIESFQLQMVGSELEEIVMEKREVQPDYKQVALQDLPNLQELWAQFYDKAINGLPTQHRVQAQRLIEEYLVQQGRRISLDEVICAQILPHAESLKALVDSRLLRIEANNKQGFSYEVSHDTLIKPIQEKFEKRQTELKEAQLKAQAQADREMAETKDKEAKHNRRMFYMAMVALCFAVVACGVAFYFYLESEKSKAELVRNQAKNLLNERVKVEKEYELAEAKEKAQQDSVKRELERQEQKIVQDRKETEYKAQQEKLLAEQRKQQEEIERKKSQLESTQYAQALHKARETERHGDSYLTLKKCEDAKEMYQKALFILQKYPNSPEYQAIQAKLKQVCP